MRGKLFEYRVFSVPYFQVFNANMGKYGPEKNLHTNIFQATKNKKIVCNNVFPL